MSAVVLYGPEVRRAQQLDSHSFVSAREHRYLISSCWRAYASMRGDRRSPINTYQRWIREQPRFRAWVQIPGNLTRRVRDRHPNFTSVAAARGVVCSCNMMAGYANVRRPSTRKMESQLNTLVGLLGAAVRSGLDDQKKAG